MSKTLKKILHTKKETSKMILKIVTNNWKNSLKRHKNKSKLLGSNLKLAKRKWDL